MARFQGPPSVFQDVNQRSMFGHDINQRLYNDVKDSLFYVQRLDLCKRLKVHKGCVNTISWNDKGQYLLSGSDDQTIVVTNPFTSKILVQYNTAHRANIFSAKFMPQSNDCGIVSCSGDGIVLYTELANAPIVRNQNPSGSPEHHGNDANDANLNYFNCHSSGTTYEVLTVPSEPNSFMSCGEDGTVRLFDLRQISRCHKTCCKDNILILSPSAVTAMCLSPRSYNYIAVGSSDSIIRIYDRRYLSLVDFSIPGSPSKKHTVPVKAFTIPSYEKRPFRVTSVSYSADESELLVSYSSDHLYLFNVTKEGIDIKQSMTDNSKRVKTSKQLNIDPPVRRLRLRGDWSDTGPDARPERELARRVTVGQARPQLQATIMHRMTEVLSRMLADPRTRIGLNSYSNEITHENDIAIANAVSLENFFPYTPQGAPPVESPTQECQTPAENPGPSGSSSQTASTSKASDTRKKDDSDDSDDENDSRKMGTKKKKKVAATPMDEFDNAVIDDEEMKSAVFEYLQMKFTGHRNARTMIKEATFWGNNYVMSGSDCGHVFIWDRKSGELVMLLEADKHVVNCLQPHPTLPYLATSGIDYDMKLYTPSLRDDDDETLRFDKEKANDLMMRNAVMLEETKDTITVPAAFMIRMLACIHSLRNRQPANRAQSNSAPNSNDAARDGHSDGNDNPPSGSPRRNNDDGSIDDNID